MNLLYPIFPFKSYHPRSLFYRLMERDVPHYELPDPLTFENGERVKTPGLWERRRNEILDLFKQHVYGTQPLAPEGIYYEEIERNTPYKIGKVKAFRTQIKLSLSGTHEGPFIHVLIYIPEDTTGDIDGNGVPGFIGLNFRGNHTIAEDPDIIIPNLNEIKKNKRGSQTQRWPLSAVLSEGFAVITANYEEIARDNKEKYRLGIRELFDEAEYTWNAIGTWAWGLSRIMDFIEAEKPVDPSMICVFGHSRLGKTALWAGALDERFAAVISNDSGCGGAALSRRRFGETVKRINKSFPHWFCDKFKEYNDREDLLPIDQHQLISLIAPRPVYIASASRDLWADPRGEFLSAKHASAVYKLLGTDGFELEDIEWPEVERPVFSTIGHHIRKGFHNILAYDWQNYVTFCKIHLLKKIKR